MSRRVHDLVSTPLVAAIAGVMFAFSLSAQVHAAEVIKSFHSDIDLAASGAMRVTETITVNVENRQIRHGIYRDLPFIPRGQNGSKADFELQSVARDGKPEPFRTAPSGIGIRIYAGSANKYVSPGLHRYRFTYMVQNQVRAYQGHDVLYWNVTGNGWSFPIEKAGASVTLPSGTKPSNIRLYTGPRGSTEHHAKAWMEGGKTVIETTRPLAQGGGLSIMLSMPRGTVAQTASGRQVDCWWCAVGNNILTGIVSLWLPVGQGQK